MGEAKQRKLARAAGQPWERDRPAKPRPLPWYMEGSTEAAPTIPQRSESILLNPPFTDPKFNEELQRKLELEHGAGRVVVIGDDPRNLSVLRRRRPMDLAIMLGMLGAINGDSLITRPRRK